MENHTRGSGKRILLMVKGFISIKMEVFILVSSAIIREMDKVS